MYGGILAEPSGILVERSGILVERSGILVEWWNFGGINSASAQANDLNN